jgi:hypothetical protein
MSRWRIDIKVLDRHHPAMRTTLTLDDDVLELAARQAKLRGVSLGKAVSELVRRGLNASTAAQVKHGVVIFQLPEDSPEVTTHDVRRIESEGA